MPMTCISRMKPGITITVTGIVDGATGSVNSEPPGLSVDGAGTASKAFAEPVKRTATPKKLRGPCFPVEGATLWATMGKQRVVTGRWRPIRR